jgi:single-stranded-DNA-specific exonuclease
VFLVSEARVAKEARVGEDHLKLDLSFGDARLPAFGPRMAARAPGTGSRVRVLGALRVDAWRGRDQVELRIDDLEVLR